MDGSRRKQKALPMMVLRKMMDISVSEWDEAVSWLLIGAIFFAMRSCEYLETNAKEASRRTKILRVRNIQFLKDGRRVKHDHPQLEHSDIVMITFEFQKNDTRDVQIHMFKTSDNVLNPVKAWAKTVKRILSYKDGSEDSKVCAFQHNKSTITHLKADDVRTRLRAIVALIGEDILGFTKDDIGLHSLRSGGAMAMFLSGTSTIVIRRVGRWSSEAFLEYIREQVQDFTAGVAEQMLQFENFSNLNIQPSKIPPPIDQLYNKENGPTSTPFTVKFSDLALDLDMEPRRRRARR